jgi:translation initiation factor 1 (eIF-1/SUI1)
MSQELEDIKEELAEYKWISKELAKALGCGCTIGGDFDLCIDCADTQKAYKRIQKIYEPKQCEQNSQNR